MIKIKVFFADGDSLVTRFNGTIQQAINYYVGNVFQLGLDEDTKTKCTHIHQL